MNRPTVTQRRYRHAGPACVLVVALLSACAHMTDNGAVPPASAACPAVQAQGNGGSIGRCKELPAGCHCQEM